MAGGVPIDHRADLFAFGVVAYELLCGATPYSAHGQGSGHVAKFASPPLDVATQRLDVPPVVAQLVMQCLEVDPAARPQVTDAIVKQLEAAMSATPLAPVGDDPSVTRKAFAWYALAFVAATGLAWFAMIGLGLPDWVFPGATILMALGLPVVTTAALTRRAAFQSSFERHAEVSRVGWLFTPGPMTVRLAQALTWRRIVTGGSASLGAFGLLVAGFMTTRALGIGPAGSLLAKGQVTRQAQLLIADFTSAPDDSVTARTLAEAVSLGLQQSNVVSVMTPLGVADALRRMQREPSERLTFPLSRELAMREGIRAIVTGELRRDTDRYHVRLLLHAPDSGNVLAAEQASATTENLVAIADQLTRALRSRIGESLKRVRETPPLEKVTTSSLEALRLYTGAVRAHELEGDLPRAWGLLTRALEIDSTFAFAWRKLWVVTGAMSPAPAFPLSRAELLDAAFRHRNNATDNERNEIEAQYYWRRAERLRAIAAFHAVATRTGRPAGNYAWYLLPLREFARSESLAHVIIAQNRHTINVYDTYLWALLNQGKHHAADSVARAARARFQTGGRNLLWLTTVACGIGALDRCEAELDTLRARNSRNSASLEHLAELALRRGQLTRWRQLTQEVARLAVERRAPDTSGVQLERAAWVDLMIRRVPAHAVARIDSLRRPANDVATQLYALASQVDRARSLIDARQTELGSRQPTSFVQAMAAFAAAEGRAEEAVQLYRTADRRPDGTTVNICSSCLFLELALVFDAARQRDSAVSYFERFLTTPLYNPEPTSGGPWQSRFRMRWWRLVNEPWVHERLAALYEELGNNQNAITHLEAFIEVWKDADPELQPRVVAARRRLARLKSS
jgi:tetratricopeptide (TPR) repeat protein